jgi:hypothetical protein
MRGGFRIVAVVVTILAVVGIGVGAYNAGEPDGIAQGIQQVQVAQETGQDVQVVHVVDDGRHGFFFPGFFLFPLVLFGLFFLIGGIFRGAGRWGGPGHGPGPWNDEGRRRFEERAREWHRHEHGQPEQAGPPPAPAA